VMIERNSLVTIQASRREWELRRMRHMVDGAGSGIRSGVVLIHTANPDASCDPWQYTVRMG